MVTCYVQDRKKEKSTRAFIYFLIGSCKLHVCPSIDEKYFSWPSTYVRTYIFYLKTIIFFLKPIENLTKSNWKRTYPEGVDISRVIVTNNLFVYCGCTKVLHTRVNWKFMFRTYAIVTDKLKAKRMLFSWLCLNRKFLLHCFIHDTYFARDVKILSFYYYDYIYFIIIIIILFIYYIYCSIVIIFIIIIFIIFIIIIITIIIYRQ